MRHRRGGSANPRAPVALLLAFAGAGVFSLSASPALAQFSQNGGAGDNSPSFLQGEADRQAMENWFNSLSGDYHAGAEFWAAQRNTPHPLSCYDTQGAADPAQFTAGCEAARERLGPIDARRDTDPEYRHGWNTYPPAGPAIQPAPPVGPPVEAAPTVGPPVAAAPETQPAPPPAPAVSNFTPNGQGVLFLKNLVDQDGSRAAAGQPPYFSYQSLPAPTDSDDFRQTANGQIDTWMQSGTLPDFAADATHTERLFAFYWIGTQFPPDSQCLITPRSNDCDLQILQKLSNLTSNPDFQAAYTAAATFLNLPPLN